jgi:hypothetical protein
MLRVDSRYDRLAQILHSNEGDIFRDYDEDIAYRGSSEFALIVSSRTSQMSAVGSMMEKTDREFRRAATILRGGRRYLGGPGYRPRPISAAVGGLELLDAAPGSFHLLVTAYGDVLSLLLSQPITALTTVLTLGQGFGDIRVWRRKRTGMLGEANHRRVLEAIGRAGGDVSALAREAPSHKLDLREFRHETQGREVGDTETISLKAPGFALAGASVPGIADELNKIDYEIFRGRSITYVRNYIDGTQDIAHIGS